MERLSIPLLVLATCIVYLPALHGDFVWDDSLFIVDNPMLGDLDGLRRIWLEPGVITQYYPLSVSSFWLEYQLWQLEPSGYHAINIVLHATNALLVWLLLRRLSLPGAALAAFIFALHPVHVESVAWISERKNLLSGLFYLSAALSYLKFRGLAVERLRKRWPFYFLALLLFACALLSKTVTASLPAAILLVIYWKEGRFGPRDVALLLPFFAFGIAAGLNTAWMERIHVGASGADWNLTLIERWLIASRALCFYPAKLIWPSSLAFNYPRWQVDATQGWQYLYGVAVVGGLALLWVRRERLGRGPLVAALFFAGTLFPALGFVDLYPMRFTFVADHFQYLASLGLIAAFAAGVAGAIGHATSAPGRLSCRAAIGLTLVVLGSQTYLHSRIFRDEETLWRDTLEKNPDSWLAHNNLGQILGVRREHELAEKHFRRAVELEQDDHLLETNLAEALVHLGEYREALRHVRRALEIEPDHANAHYFAWVALSHLGQLNEASHHLRRQSSLEPSFEAHYDAARLLARAGRPRDALLELELARSFRPRSAELAFMQGKILMALDEPEGAVAAFRAAIRIRPNWAPAHNRLAHALEAVGEVEQAKIHSDRALQIDPTDATERQDRGPVRARRGGAAADEPGSAETSASFDQR